METLSLDAWTKYKDTLSLLSNQAAEEFRDAVWGANGYFKGAGLANIPKQELISYAFALVTKYGEASAALAAQVYDMIAELSGVYVPDAVPAETMSRGEVAKTLQGVSAATQNEDAISSTIGRMVKQAAADTTVKNAIRDGAQFAWIPSGDTCAFCIMLASNGWKNASKKALKNGHAEHIHSHCDCEYAVRFNNDFEIEGYDPDKYYDMYKYGDGIDQDILDEMYDTTGWSQSASLNAMRRQFYRDNRIDILEQKQYAYAKRQELESSEAEEVNVN